MKLFSRLAAGLLAAVTLQAQATFITVNGEAVDALQIDNTVSSFQEFYDYRGRPVFTTGLPFAQDDAAVFFIAQLNGERALFGLFDDYTGQGVGATNITFSLDSELAFDYADDSGDLSSRFNGTNNSVRFTWSRGKGDGFFSLLPEGAFDFTSMIDSTNLSTFTFLSFDEDNNVASFVDFSDTGTLNVQDASAPATIGLFGLVLAVIGGIRRMR